MKFATVFIFIMTFSQLAFGQDIVQWRGPDRDGILSGKKFT